MLALRPLPDDPPGFENTFWGRSAAESFPECTTGEARITNHSANAYSSRRSLRNVPSQFLSVSYALENFDPIGHWRTHDQIGQVDASGTFVDGTPFNGVVELRKVLLERPDAFRTSITESLLAYSATGSVNLAKGTPATLIRARQILTEMDKPRWSTLIAAIVQTKP